MAGRFSFFAGSFLLGFSFIANAQYVENNRFVEIKDVKVNDSFWAPRLQQWGSVTAKDVLDKFEGKHHHDPATQARENTFSNFDRVACGQTGCKEHAGLPWFDGLVYETIRGLADLLKLYPDKELENRIDGYVDRIVKAQQADPDGYIGTYTQLMVPDQRWGDNGGFLRFQHDVYNAGMLIEAGIHYYEATGKTALLEVATRFANHMSDLMGEAPKRNMVPSHSGPEEPMVKLYWLYKNDPGLKNRVTVPVNENDYFELATFWIENRGNHCGYPLWLEWGNDKSEQWIREVKYTDPAFGPNSRPTWGDYAQDSISVFEQTTIEGHAVRATLLATGIAAAAIENNSPRYLESVNRLWDNMVGKRMFITGGVGAIHHDEKFGPDYFLPTDAYLETCAAVGAGFFSQRMNELFGDGKYMDEFERVLYNNVLTGISLSGVEYTYQNPLNSDTHSRWEWHSCPCCPPMFLKMVSSVPGYIYSYGKDHISVNLFVGSETTIQEKDLGTVHIKQETGYPWNGSVLLKVDPEIKEKFTLRVRIPGWAQGIENPYGLYRSDLKTTPILTVNGKKHPVAIKDGYAEINRTWKKGDQVQLELPVQPRIIQANDQVADLTGKVVLASGPLIYCAEGENKDKLEKITPESAVWETHYEPGLLGGTTVVRLKDNPSVYTIPYFLVGNRPDSKGYRVWFPLK